MKREIEGGLHIGSGHGMNMMATAALVLEEFTFNKQKLYKVHKNRWSNKGLEGNELLTRKEVDVLIENARGRGFVLYV